MELIDSHCHLDDDRFDNDRDAVVAQAKSLNINKIVIPATTANRWAATVKRSDAMCLVTPSSIINKAIRYANHAA